MLYEVITIGVIPAAAKHVDYVVAEAVLHQVRIAEKSDRTLLGQSFGPKRNNFV